MRAGLFVPSLCGGGAERVMVNLARGLSERGIQVDVVLAKAQGVFLAHVPCGARVVDLGAGRVHQALPGLVRYLRRARPDCVLSAMNHANLVAVLANLLSGNRARTVASVHNTLSIEVNQARTLRMKLTPLLVRVFYRWADGVVAVSEGVAEDLAGRTSLDRERITVIYNPVVTSDLLARAEGPLEHPWFAAREAPVVLGVGRLSVQKDFASLVRAFAIARRDRPARLMILGEGEDRPQIEAQVARLGLEGQVALPGFVENPYPYLKRARVFALSSKWEGLPTVLIEALALGTSVVATDCPSGPVEILEGGKWGRLVPVGDDRALADAILASLSDPEVPDEARQRMVQRFGLDAAVDQYMEILGLA